MTPYLATDGTPARVLIVDDDQDNRELLQIMLRWEGFVTVTAESGKEAMATVEKLLPHVVLVDLMMPDMDGYQVARQMKASGLTNNIIVVIVSAMSDKASQEAAFAAGADDFLSKPVNRLELSARVKKLVAGKAAGPGCVVASVLLPPSRVVAPPVVR
jgi:diguanylate cyclase